MQLPKTFYILRIIVSWSAHTMRHVVCDYHQSFWRMKTTANANISVYHLQAKSKI